MIWACSIASGRTATRPIKGSWNLIRAVALVAQGTLLADTPRAAPGYEAGQAADWSHMDIQRDAGQAADQYISAPY